MNMFATIIQSDNGSLLVRDSATDNEVIVFYQDASHFTPGDRVQITYSGAMTLSNPPQITATSIQRLQGSAPTMPQPQPTQAEIIGIVLQLKRTYLLIRDTESETQIIVNYPFAYHFCVGQQIIVMYENIMLSNPPQIEATDIMPMCWIS